MDTRNLTVRLNNTKKWIFPILLVFAFGIGGSAPRWNAAPVPQSASGQASPKYEAWLARKVQKRLVTIPWYGVFDNLEYRIEGTKVILLGQVVFPVTRSSVADSAKGIEGVTQVVNDVKTLPNNPFDNQIREAEYRALFFYGSPLFHYSRGVNPRIHIIVDNGHVTLVGVVDNRADREMAGMRAKTVPTVLSVTNQLRIV